MSLPAAVRGSLIV